MNIDQISAVFAYLIHFPRRNKPSAAYESNRVLGSLPMLEAVSLITWKFVGLSVPLTVNERRVI